MLCSVAVPAPGGGGVLSLSSYHHTPPSWRKPPKWGWSRAWRANSHSGLSALQLAQTWQERRAALLSRYHFDLAQQQQVTAVKLTFASPPNCTNIKEAPTLRGGVFAPSNPPSTGCAGRQMIPSQHLPLPVPGSWGSCPTPRNPAPVPLAPYVCLSLQTMRQQGGSLCGAMGRA